MAIEPIKLVYLFGWVNIIGLILVLFSCRCIPNIIPKKLRESRAYNSFFKYHCYYWWFFIISVAIHSIFAITALGNPFIKG